VGCPELSGVLSDIEVNYTPAGMRQYHKQKQHSKRDGGHSEKINRNQIVEVIVQKGSPGSVRVASCPEA
jgi:hypothetical protein